jgi:Zn-dependent peptidase ImmA (M78 family)/transcriptional regulator with XRE-family HTH domain
MEIGARLRMARRMARLSLRALGDQVGVSHTAISKYERGMDVPSSGVLNRLADALGVSLDYLLRPTTVRVEPGAYRHHTKIGAREKKAIIAQVEDRLERYLRAERLCQPFAGPLRPDLLELEASTLQDVESAAEELRAHWNVGLGAIPNLSELLEERGVKVVDIQGFKRFEAQTLWANGELAVIGVNADVPGDRQRFSLAHELGHLVLRVEDGLNDERAANRFAGAFLVPRATALRMLRQSRGNFTIGELGLLKDTFGLSMQAWIHRAMDLGVISSTVAGRWFHTFRARGWSVREPGAQYPRERAARVERLVVQAYAEGALSAARAAELLEVSLTQFRRDLGRTVDEPAGQRRS